MARKREIAIDTNIAFDMIAYYNKYLKSENRETFFSDLLEKENLTLNKTVEEFQEFVKNGLGKYQTRISELQSLKDKKYNNKREDSKTNVNYNLLEDYYKNNDEEKQFLTIKAMANGYKTVKKDLKSKIETINEKKKHLIEVLGKRIENIQQKLNSGELKEERIPYYMSLYSGCLRLQSKCLETLQKNLEFTNAFEKEEKQFKEKYDAYCHTRQRIDAISMCQQMVTKQVQIVLPEFVYEELCNHTKELKPYDEIKQQEITNALISKEQLNVFTSNCTLYLIQDVQVRNYINNMAFLLRSDIKDTIIQKELENKDNKGMFENFKKEDVGSCAKFADSRIAMFAYVSGIDVVTNNHDDFLGAEVAVTYNKEKTKVENISRKEARRKLFSRMVYNGLKFNDKIILLNAPKKGNIIHGEAITFYEFNGRKVKEVDKFKVCKHKELNHKSLKKLKKKMKVEFKNKAWVGSFKKVEKLVALSHRYNELKEINNMVNETRIEKENAIIAKLKEKEVKKKEKIINKENVKTKKQDKIDEDKELKLIEEKIRKAKEEFESLQNITKQNPNGTQTKLVEEQSKSRIQDNNSLEQ